MLVNAQIQYTTLNKIVALCSLQTGCIASETERQVVCHTCLGYTPPRAARFLSALALNVHCNKDLHTDFSGQQLITVTGTKVLIINYILVDGN